ncbi:MAG: hypothetical protein AB7N76_22970 [Planctomycetota bacterium]
MRLILARLALLAVTLPVTAGSAYVFWSQPTSFEWGDPTLWVVSGAALLVALVGFVASFAPFDRPQSALRWATPLCGLLAGTALSGMLCFPSTFAWVGPPLLLAAIFGFFAAREVAVGPPDLDLPTRFEDATESGLPPDATRLTPALRALLIGGVVVGAVLILAWRPRPGPRPIDLDAEDGVAAVVSRPALARPTKRVIRHAQSVEVTGREVRLVVSLERPRLELRLRDQDLIVEPCLTIEDGSVDGFPLTPLNGMSLEAAGPALVDFREGQDLAWVRVAYPHGRARYRGLAERTAFFSRKAGADSIAATLELEVDLRRGEVTVDARTLLARPAVARRTSLAWVRLRDAPELPVRLGLGEGIDYAPGEATGGAPLTFLSHEESQGEGADTRLLEARNAGAGPFETRELGRWQDWLVLPSEHSRVLLLAPDWRRECSLLRSRAAGFGLRENALAIWREGGGVNVLFDPAGVRLGQGALLCELPPGLYRDRLVLAPLRGAEPAAVAQRLLRRFHMAEEAGLRVERTIRPGGGGGAPDPLPGGAPPLLPGAGGG